MLELSLNENVIKIALLLGLSFLVGLEREEEKQSREKSYLFGGIRTFPLIALIGYLLVVFQPASMIMFALGFAVIGMFLVVSYWKKLQEGNHGFTSEMSGLITYLIGGAIASDLYWIAVAVGVINVFLLQMKTTFEGFAKKVSADEITTLVKFLLLAAVMLPVMPNQSFTVFQINPYKTWLIVVAVSSISYGSYLVERIFKLKQSTILSGIIGGIYSSTVTTVVLAKRAKTADQPAMYAGSIALATAMMYLRIAVLLFIFNRQIFFSIGRLFVEMGLVVIAAGLLWMFLVRDRKATARGAQPIIGGRNPLEIHTALIFAFLFIVVLVITSLVMQYFGTSGIYSLAAVMGVIDVDPFILGLTQTGGNITDISIAALAVLIACTSNNIAKGVYAMIFADKKTGLQSFVLLSVISALSMVLYLWR